MKQNFNNFPLYTKINSVYIPTIEGGNGVAGENKEKRYEKGDYRNDSRKTREN
jgi:hypothetical protein